MTKFIFSKNYNKQLEHIENYIFGSIENIENVNEFLDQHDKVLNQGIYPDNSIPTYDEE